MLPPTFVPHVGHISSDPYRQQMPFGQPSASLAAPVFPPYQVDQGILGSTAPVSASPWTMMLDQPNQQTRSSGLHASMVAGDIRPHPWNAPSGLLDATQGKQRLRINNAPHVGNLPLTPRGPPCKPRKYGWAVWVGNLPSGIAVTQLRDHFSGQAGIVSIFLIPKTNCAFVNYKSEAACLQAIQKFHNSELCGQRLCCRMRKNGEEVGEACKRRGGSLRHSSSNVESIGTDLDIRPASPIKDPDAPLIVSGSGPLKVPSPQQQQQHAENRSDVSSSAGYRSAGLEPSSARVRQKDSFFILKSLTLQDLEVSRRDGTWTTQPHNEDQLNEAFYCADNVYLIFSANKSGCYFGYARMASPIPQVGRGSPAMEQNADKYGVAAALPTIPTLPTPNTPAGRIVDDSARGVVFWEADRDDDGSEGELKGGVTDEWAFRPGRQFAVQWLSTLSVPFWATKGLRNQMNANREVKIARDGTQLDAEAARQLLDLFHGARWISRSSARAAS